MGQVADRDPVALASRFLVELHLACIALERREKRRRRRIAELGESLDRRRHGIRVGVLEKATEELDAARLSHLGEKERELGESGTSRRKALGRTFDAQRHLFEPLEGDALERLARDDPRFRDLAAENVDEQIHDAVAPQIAEDRGDAREVDGRARVIALRERLARGVLELVDELGTAGGDEPCMEVPNGAFGGEKGRQILAYGRHGRRSIRATSASRHGSRTSRAGVFCYAFEVATRWLWPAAAVLVCAALSSPDALETVRIASAAVAPSDLPSGECPAGTLPDNEVCVRLGGVAEDGPLAPAQANAHREKSGRWATYEQIPKLPDRPADYDSYRYPIPPGLPGGHYVVSGYDLDRPNESQRRGRTLRHVGHGGVDLPQTKGTPVKLVALEHQEGDAEVLYTGPLFGLTVVTRHTLREGGRPRDYAVLFGHLDSIAAGVTAGATLGDGALVGTVGDSGSPSLVHLHLEIRRVHEGLDLAHVAGGPAVLGESVSTVCDPRNVLPLK